MTDTYVRKTKFEKILKEMYTDLVELNSALQVRSADIANDQNLKYFSGCYCGIIKTLAAVCPYLFSIMMFTGAGQKQIVQNAIQRTYPSIIKQGMLFSQLVFPQGSALTILQDIILYFVLAVVCMTDMPYLVINEYFQAVVL